MARGTKTGGRKAGTLNRATVERQEMAARTLDKAKAAGRPLAKDRLDELLEIALGAMTAHQPITRDMVKKARALGNKTVKESRGNWTDFGEWWDRAAYVAKELAKFQSPTYKAVSVETPRQSGLPPVRDFNTFVRTGDPVRASRIYQEVMAAPRQLSLPPPAKRSTG
jgi:hypothetical protein